jgi:hypothetical protein
VSRWQLVVVALTVAALVALLGWQAQREHLVKACLDAGGEWDGPRSVCREPVRPILQRDYQRSGVTGWGNPEPRMSGSPTLAPRHKEGGGLA